MTFDLDPVAIAVRDAARASRLSLAAAATADAAGVWPSPAVAEASALLPARDRPLAWAVAVEEIAAVSGALALAAVGAALVPESTGAGPGWAGLRGATADDRRTAIASTDLGSVSVAAALVGMGRAVLAAVVAVLRERRDAGGTPEQREWALADAATALDAARLMTWRATQAMDSTGGSAVALGAARLLAADAAQQCLAAARRALPAEAFGAGTPLERTGRDIETAALVFGATPAHEAAVADGVLNV